MSLLLPRLLPHTPAIFRGPALAQLFQSTAAAFQCDMPPLSGLSHEQRLLLYARFTAGRAEAALRGGDDLAELRQRLYGNAYRLGRTPGRLLRLRRVDDVMALACLLYDVLGIEFEANSRGEITISRCYFSSFYSAEVCRVMSAMDGGLLAGLAGGGELVFSRRITDGQACCRARFTPATQPSAGRLRQEQTR